MKRRSFIQLISGGIAAAFLTKVTPAERVEAGTVPQPDIPCGKPKACEYGIIYWQGCENVPPDWNDARNWSGGRVPGDGDTVYFPGGSICNGADLRNVNLNGIYISPDAERIGTF